MSVIDDAARVTTALWLEKQAVKQREAHLLKLKAAIASVEAMFIVDFARGGLENLCPTDCPPEVLQYLGITDMEKHFHVSEDGGNTGIRLEVRQGSVEWDRIPDPWGELSKSHASE